MDPSNYRGITLFSSLGKIFSSLIYNRIENEIEKKTYSHLSNQALGKTADLLTIYLHFLV